jgi:hypothetical protein
VSAGDILDQIRQMPIEDWLRIQSGIGELLASSVSEGEREDIGKALAEADDDISHGRVSTSPEVREHFGLR